MSIESSDAEPTFDLKAALERLDNQQPLLIAMMSFFEGEVASAMPRLDRAVRERDMGAVAFSAHALKSQCASFGAEPLTDLVVRLERLAKSGRDQEVVDMWEYTSRCFQETATALTRERKRLESE